VEECLRHYVSPLQHDWDVLLPCVEFAINNAYHPAIGNTPFALNYGQTPLDPTSVKLDFTVPTAEAFSKDIEQHVLRAKQLLAAAQDRQAEVANRKRRAVSFAHGDQVMLNTKHLTLKFHQTPKLLPRWVGPFEVLAPVGTTPSGQPAVAYTVNSTPIVPSWITALIHAPSGTQGMRACRGYQVDTVI
jgi:hypothetical protein